MEFLEIVFVFHGRDNRFFHGSLNAGVCHGSIFLYCSFFDDRFYHRPKNDIRRPGFRLAVPGVHHTDDQRSAVFLYGYFGAVSRKDVYGSKKTSDIFGERAVLTAGD